MSSSRTRALQERALHLRNRLDDINPRTRARRAARRRRMAGALAAGAAVAAAAVTLNWRRSQRHSAPIAGPYQ
jgi:hypothetical protein